MSDPETTPRRSSRRPSIIMISLGVLVLFLIVALIVIVANRNDGSSAMVDTFARTGKTDGLGTIPDGPTWHSVSGTWEINRGFAAVKEPGTPASVAIAEMPGQGDVSTQVEHLVPGAGLVFRYQSPTSYWKVVAAPKVLTWQICKVQDGRVTIVGNTGPYSPVDDSTTVSVQAHSRSIDVLLNGKSRKTVFDNYLSSATGAGLVVTGPDAGQARFSRFAFDPH